MTCLMKLAEMPELPEDIIINKKEEIEHLKREIKKTLKEKF